jgi:Putative 2OG-Fe(II) oxygenase
MPDITSLFVTRLYRAGLNDLAKKKVDYAELHMTCDAVAEDDEAGQEWCEANGYPGYTSYASLKCNSLWINILPEGGTHASHIHPHSVISGTTYVAMPEGTSALKLEDPRLPMMMLAPVPLKTAPQELQRFVYVKPAVGEVLLWESWLRHEVPMNMSEEERISVSFNYGWA